MSITQTTTTKRTPRRKAAEVVSANISIPPASVSAKSIESVINVFNDLIEKIDQAKAEFEKLEKEIAETREFWIKEQKDYELQFTERKQQEEISKRREQEAYDYEIALTRKKAADEFAEKRAKWEKELDARKEEIENDKKELEMLRKQAAGFESEKEKAIKEAVVNLQKDLTDKFDTERKLREQEIRSEKEILNLKIENLSIENTKLTSEIVELKKALNEATKQVKDIAVKVIESSSAGSQTSNSPEE